MPTVSPCPIPDTAFLRQYTQGTGFTDCYCTGIDATVSLETYLRAFYATPLFRTERLILKHLVARPSTDRDLEALASGAADTFAAWRVEARAPDQILLADFSGRTRSWLMVAACGQDDAPARTRLYFGSAVVPRPGRAGHPPRMGFAFSALLGFHRMYSRLLLGAARARILDQRKRLASKVDR